MSDNLPVKTIQPGELHVQNRPCRIKTLLGSCVSVTVCHENGYGGMNHFMLPEVMPERQKGPRDFRFGDLSVRYLMDKMLEYDSDVSKLDAKIFGGGRVVSALARSNIGRSNVECAESVLAEYGITPSEKHVQGKNGLKLDFNTKENVVTVEKIQNTDRSEQPEPTENQEQKRLEKNENRVAEILSSDEQSHGIDFLSN